MTKKIMALLMVMLIALTGCTKPQDDQAQDTPEVKQNINLYYPNIDDGKYYFIAATLEAESEAEVKDNITELYKANVLKGTGPVFSENTQIKEINLDDEGILHIDFNDAFRYEMNAGSQYEAMILQSITNTFGQYYETDRVIVTVEGVLYESGHILLEEGDFFETDYSNIAEVQQNIC